MAKSFFQKIIWQCYAITIIVSTGIYFIVHYMRLGRPWDYLFGYGIAGTILLYILAFSTALILGTKDAYLKWWYPVLAATFTWFVPPTLFLLLFSSRHAAIRVDTYYFNHLIFGFIEVFVIQLLVAILGLAIGRKCR